MELKKEVYQKYNFYTIKNKCGLEITFSDYGASIYSIKLNNHYLTYHEEDYDAFFKSNKFSGKTLGRIAGRIKGGVLKIGSKTYHIEKNENNNTLHGGKHCLSFQKFETSLSESEELYNIVFKYTSPANECGFPHEVRFIVVYSMMKNENKFSIHYHANVNGLTPISMAPHIYWRLLDKDVLNHRLMINANYVAKTDKELVITGKEKVKKAFDFRSEKRIGVDIPITGYDHTFILNKGDKPQITLRNAGIKLSIKTDMEATQVYTNCYPGINKIKGYGKDIKYGGVAIEPQMFNPTNKSKLIIKPKQGLSLT